MRVLAMDTATRATAVGLCDDVAGVARERRDDPPAGARPGHASRLLALAAEVMEDAGVGWEEIDRIAVGTGPGTFTGLRIGIATARALATARGIPLVGVSTLESLALNGVGPVAPGAPGVDVISAVIDARRGEVFAAAWRVAPGGGPGGADALSETLLEPAPIAPEALAQWLTEIPGRRLAIGDGAIEFQPVLERSGALIPDAGAEVHKVTALNHCVLARELRAGAAEDVRPEYLRRPDAEIARRTSSADDHRTRHPDP